MQVDHTLPGIVLQATPTCSRPFINVHLCMMSRINGQRMGDLVTEIIQGRCWLCVVSPSQTAFGYVRPCCVRQYDGHTHLTYVHTCSLPATNLLQSCVSPMYSWLCLFAPAPSPTLTFSNKNWSTNWREKKHKTDVDVYYRTRLG